MDDLHKIDSIRLFNFWRLLALCLGVLTAMFVVTRFFPTILSPVFSLLCALVIYRIVNVARGRFGLCSIVPYAIFLSLVIYSLIAVVVNLSNAVGLVSLPDEVIFYQGAYMPSLMYLPTATATLFVTYLQREKINLCRDCKIRNSEYIGGNRISRIYSSESHFQLRNLTVMLLCLTVLVWGYFLIFYVNASQNARDWYIFTWIVVIVFLLDIVYFTARYYNLYLDLRENDEIITPEEIEDMTAKTYLRFYVICGNNIYVDEHFATPDTKCGEVMETPFLTKRNVNGLPSSAAGEIIREMTGVDGELRFFYGRRTGIKGHTLLRYFYFVKPGSDGGCPPLKTEGRWMDYEVIKQIYSTEPGRLSRLSVIDTTRLSTIILTSKIYDEQGVRRLGIRNYRPNFNLRDVYQSDIDFQDDKWIRISLFNSDMPLFRLRSWWRRTFGSQNHHGHGSNMTTR